MAKAKPQGPNYAVVFAAVVGAFFVGASLVNAQSRKRARGEITKRPKQPLMLYDVATEELRAGDFIAEIGVGDAMRVRAPANASAGIFWKASVTQVGAEGSPIAINSTSEQSGEGPMALTTQNFQITGVRPGTATVLLTSTLPNQEVVDSVQFHVEVTE